MMVALKVLFSAVLTLVAATALAQDPPALNPKDKLVVETILRLSDFDIESSPPAKAAMLRYLRSQAGTDQYFELIERFKLVDVADELAEFSLQHANETSGVRAAELLFKLDRGQLLSDIFNRRSSGSGDTPEAIAADAERAIAAVALVGHAGGKRTAELLLPLVAAEDAPAALRSAAVMAIGRRIAGQQQLLTLVSQGKLADDLKFAAANVLLSSDNPMIAEEAAKYLELPATADSQPLPSLAELVKRRGNVAAGAEVFRTVGTCNKCHKVAGEGKDVGPDLSEIGSKLAREAMYVAILDPSAAVSHSYETYAALTDEGETIVGLLVSDTDDAVTLRTSEGIDKTLDKDTVVGLKKQSKSLMPQDLQRLLTVEQLVDLVEYTMSLKKKE